MMNRSLDQSWFRVAFDYLNMFRMGACIYYTQRGVYQYILKRIDNTLARFYYRVNTHRCTLKIAHSFNSKEQSQSVFFCLLSLSIIYQR
jgi:regulation of enolase protein 1 (concanavalin A-like superfamily)